MQNCLVKKDDKGNIRYAVSHDARFLWFKENDQVDIIPLSRVTGISLVNGGDGGVYVHTYTSGPNSVPLSVLDIKEGQELVEFLTGVIREYG
jgi:hypothetical protein